jgi:hypothetical protein
MSIVILDNVLTKEECEALIAIYAQNRMLAHTHLQPPIYPINLDVLNNKYVTDCAKWIEHKASVYFGNNVIDWAELVCWPMGTWQPYHTDEAEERTILTSITYLNDDYAGGCTVFKDGTKVRPVAGRTLIFNGKEYVHGVEPVQLNARFTLPIWYKKDE